MKTVVVPERSEEINALLEQARHEDLLVRSADGGEFVLVAVDGFDVETARTRQNPRLMAFLEERGRQAGTIPLVDVERELGLSDSGE